MVKGWVKDFTGDSDIFFQTKRASSYSAAKTARDDFKDGAIAREETRLEALENIESQSGTYARLLGRRPAGVVNVEYAQRSLKRLRMMEQNIYGLVNVRTDGQKIMCASKRDSGEKWTIHSFDARFAGVV